MVSTINPPYTPDLEHTITLEDIANKITEIDDNLTPEFNESTLTVYYNSNQNIVFELEDNILSTRVNVRELEYQAFITVVKAIGRLNNLEEEEFIRHLLFEEVTLTRNGITFHSDGVIAYFQVDLSRRIEKSI